jgi:Tol biopolymer transport system component
VQYMKDGDYLLLGPRDRNDAFISGVYKTGFLWMPADLSTPPQWLGEEHYEGVAVSRESRKIAYAKTWLERPGQYPAKLCTAEITKDGKLVNIKTVYRSAQIIEAQDFLPGDRGITFTRYTPNYDAFGIDLETKKVTNYSISPASEIMEGIFPDGAWALISSDRHARKPGDMDLDVYMLKLDGTGKNVRRLTNFSDTPGQDAVNPVASPEGCRVAFQKSVQEQDNRFITGKEAGIYLLEFFDCKQR